MKKYFTSLFISLALFTLPIAVSAEGSAALDTQIQKLSILIQELTRQVNDLQKKVNALLVSRLGIAITIDAGMAMSTGLAITPVDIAPPVISGLAVSGVSSTTATVSWVTDELATGFVYFATSTPLIRSQLAPFGSSMWSKEHILNLIELKPANTYYFVAESADVLRNTTLSLEKIFVTPAK